MELSHPLLSVGCEFWDPPGAIILLKSLGVNYICPEARHISSEQRSSLYDLHIIQCQCMEMVVLPYCLGRTFKSGICICLAMALFVPNPLATCLVGFVIVDSEGIQSKLLACLTLCWDIVGTKSAVLSGVRPNSRL